MAALPARLARQVSLAAELNPQLNAFTSLAGRADVERQYALSQQQQQQRQGVDMKGKGKEVLRGRSVAVKDNFVTAPSGEGEEGEHAPTTCASRMLQNYKSPFEATVVRLLRQQGGIIVGKTNMDEFGMGSATIHSPFGPTLNPSHPLGLSHALDPANSAERRVAGGSSGGSAAAVAAGMADFALASDTGGSTRLPSSYTGACGFKPSYGLLSRYGLVAYASSLDTVGIIGPEGGGGETVRVAESLSAFDPQDPTSAPLFARERAEKAHRELRDRLASAGGGKGLEGVRVGVPADLFPLPPTSPLLLLSSSPIRSFLRTLRDDLGATLVPLRLRTAPVALSAYYVIASAEASSNLARYRGVEYGFRAPDDLVGEEKEGEDKLPLFARTRSLGFGREVKKRVLLGTFALSAEAFDNYFLQAQRVRRLLQDEIDSLFRVPNPLRPSSTSSTSSSPSPLSAALREKEGVDFLVHPSAMSTAPLLSTYTSPSPPTSKEKSRDPYIQDLLSLPASLAGLPALSIPAGRVKEREEEEGGEGWPVGMTLVGQWGADGTVGEVGGRVEEALAARRRREEGEGK